VLDKVLGGRSRMLGFLALCALAATPISAGEGRAIVLRAARVVTAPGDSFEGHVLVADGLVRRLGSFEVPAGARVVNARGLTVYAGFIDAWSHLGFEDRKPAEEGRSARESGPPNLDAGPPITMPESRRKGLYPSFDAAISYAPASKKLAAHRAAGYASALVAPRFGYLAGRSALVQLRSGPRRDVVLTAPVAAHASFSSGGGSGYPSTVMGVMAHLRQFFSDSGRYRDWRELYRLKPLGVARPPFDPDLSAAAEILSGGRLFFAASSENEIRRALALSDEFGFELALTRARQGFKLAATLANKKIPVIATLDWSDEPKEPDAGKKKADKKTPTPTPTTPSKPRGERRRRPILVSLGGQEGKKPKVDKKRARRLAELKKRLAQPARVTAHKRALWLAEVQNVKALLEAGVEVALSSSGLDLRKLPERLELLRREGLSEDQLLGALTLTPAKLFGVEARLGRVVVGGAANLTVLSGPLGAKGSKLRYLMVDGELSEFNTPRAKKPGSKRPSSRPDPKKVKLAKVAGEWVIDIAGRLKGELVLEQDGDELSGVLTAAFGEATVTGRVTGQELRMEASGEAQGQSFTVIMTGSVEGARMSGRLTSPFGEGEWSAARKPSRVATKRWLGLKAMGGLK
jgi:imidazolonepropionase-like amidohydrolase